MEDVNIIFFTPATPENRTATDITNLLDQFKSARKNDWTLEEAFMCLVLSAAISDGSISEEERAEVEALSKRSRALKSLGPTKLAEINKTVQQRLSSRPEGVREACEALPQDVRLSVFAHCVDICLADGVLLRPETDFLNQIGGYMKITREEALKILEVMLIKNRY